MSNSIQIWDDETRPGIDRILAVMAQLRNPDGGCPWDLEQTYRTIAPYTIEEAYEVADAIEQDDMDGLKEELGDLLLQTVFHAQMASEDGLFDFNDVAAGIADKMVRRHPHVFGDASHRNADEQTAAWETLKAQERAEKSDGTPASLLDNVPTALPASTRAVKLQKRAARVGFDWGAVQPVLDQMTEEIEELAAELAVSGTPDPDRVEDEFGDLMFCVINLARHLKVDPEAALRRTNAKFERRFRYVEENVGKAMSDASLNEMEALWQEAKKLDPHRQK